ncbi:ATP phosphoribosyltransferase [Chryseobacterium gotjawalense]|uniref:ATP phosphoribosyltransferase n=1 Tax=Chryseobacterium gotjawalense TaxID=3042315 RepID=A0ABY8RH74_9FLAO|nr:MULTISPECIES: ATP phosphoribosyltransferase [unclassified Chryseobacterium]MDQ0476332.1 ATP phosphoribosyltransferase [Chryseobacterium sp. MDT2-18]WHF52578.1 ATP phosphoribosyltransferase [Chryseobacterium sp. wdc7]
MNKLKIAIQKTGRLSEKSLELLKECGIKIPDFKSKLKNSATNFPLEILFLRDDDIPKYVEQGIVDIGIIGENEVLEQGKNVEVVRKLGFANCRLSLAIPKEQDYSDLSFFNQKKIATSYPNIVKNYFEKNNIEAEIVEISGSVEIAPSIGLADTIADLVSSGSTLLHNGLKEVEQVLKSEAVLISSQNLPEDISVILESFLFRIQAVINSRENKYILLNAPNDAIDRIIEILPGMKSPTVLPLAESGWSSIHSVVRENEFWKIIDELKKCGAEGILVIPIEKMVL